MRHYVYVWIHSQLIRNITHSYAPFYYDLLLNYLAFGIIIGDPSGCHVTLELGAWQKNSDLAGWKRVIFIHLSFIYVNFDAMVFCFMINVPFCWLFCPEYHGKVVQKLLKFMRENLMLPILHGVRFLNQFVTCGLMNSRQVTCNFLWSFYYSCGLIYVWLCTPGVWPVELCISTCGHWVIEKYICDVSSLQVYL